MIPIQVSDQNFERLQRIAVPLVDSIDTVVARLLDSFETREHMNGKVPSNADRVLLESQFSAEAPPTLKHTKLLSAELNGKPIAEVNWNGLLRAALISAKASTKDKEALKRLIAVNFVFGRKEDEGFKYLPRLDISVQGQDAIDAWKGALHVAQQLRIPLTAAFVWRNKPAAFRPGETGRLVYRP